jgi:hypothetical protein
MKEELFKRKEDKKIIGANEAFFFLSFFIFFFCLSQVPDEKLKPIISPSPY